MSPQDDHVIEFAKQFGWDSNWMEKQAKKKGKKKLDEEAARGSQDVGEMLGNVHVMLLQVLQLLKWFHVISLLQVLYFQLRHLK